MVPKMGLKNSKSVVVLHKSVQPSRMASVARSELISASEKDIDQLSLVTIRVSVTLHRHLIQRGDMFTGHSISTSHFRASTL